MLLTWLFLGVLSSILSRLLIPELQLNVSTAWSRSSWVFRGSSSCDEQRRRHKKTHDISITGCSVMMACKRISVGMMCSRRFCRSFTSFSMKNMSICWPKASVTFCSSSLIFRGLWKGMILWRRRRRRKRWEQEEPASRSVAALLQHTLRQIDFL